MRKMYLFSMLIVSVFFYGCGGGGASSATEPEVITAEPPPAEVAAIDPSESAKSPNILFIIADDLGKDAIKGYTEGEIKPDTPNIEQLANSGLTFNNLWVYPVCSPTRASIITGKHANKTGVRWSGDILDSSETILQQYINNETNYEYATAIVGKWHLAGNENAAFNPENLGVDYYAGLLSGGDDYYEWTLSEDGTRSTENSYITETFTDLSMNWIAEQEKPWFLWLAYTAPHKPFHTPPSGMHSQGALPAYVEEADPMPYYMAAIEAMDYQIGRLINNIPADELENTVVIVIGDNGSPSQVAQSPYSRSRAKGSLYQGGINTPMFISGAGVERMGVDNNVISSTDLFATIAEIAGVSINEIHDSKSFKPLLTRNEVIRAYQYAEVSSDSVTAWTISNGIYKLMIDINGNEQMYDLANDPYETTNLLTNALTSHQVNIKLELEAELLNIREGGG